ncbi:MAG TPA: ATP-binding protein [Actinoplanes sp.]|nr:ATP-binding protein [Actinoplanes sp.]
MPSPTLIVVSGPPGAGKTTLAHTVAAAIGCPAICRDEIKEGMVHARPGYGPSLSDELNRRTLAAFFDVLRLLLGAGVTVVAEAAFQDRLWRPGLESLLDLATVRIIRCTASAEVARKRIARRLEEDLHRAAHDDREYLEARTIDGKSLGTFSWITLSTPSFQVDTSVGYIPPLPDILAFINESGGDSDGGLGAIRDPHPP